MARARRKKSAGSSNSDEAIELPDDALGDGAAEAEEDNFPDDLADVAEPDEGALEDDFVDDDADGDDDPDAKAVEVPSTISTPNGLAVRREIERRLEERRLARDMDDLDFDLD